MSQRGREITQMFSKVNALRKRKAGAYNQKEDCLKFIQVERDIRHSCSFVKD